MDTTLIFGLQEHVKGLEEERRKIEAFKRELPLCMQLLNETIEASKERLATQMPSFLNTQPDLHLSHVNGFSSEESAPRKRRTKDLSKDNCSVVRETQDNVKGENLRLSLTEVPMVGSQQENLERESVASREKTCNEIPRVVLEQLFNSASKPVAHLKPKLGGAFSPFQREKQAPQPLPQLDLLHTLISSNGAIDCMGKCEGESSKSHEMKKGSPNDSVDLKSKEEEGAPPQKKSRRCWSPELHRRFVNALQQLGGSHVATPKQIRESMNVDGLTNDEVKSHLQKYRLHTKRSSLQATVATPQLVVFGGIWVPPEYAHQSPPLYNSDTHVCEAEFPPQNLYRHQGALQMPCPAYYRSPLQEPFQSFSAHAATSIEVGREESTGELDGKSENSSSKTQTQTKLRDCCQGGEELRDTLNSYRGSLSNLSLRF